MAIEFHDRSNDEIDVEKEIGIRYMYNKHPRRGYHCVYTEGLERYGCPELCLMDYYDPDSASYILYNMADCLLNGDSLFDEESGEYNFFSVVTIQDEDGTELTFGFIGGWLYDEPVMVLQLLDEKLNPVHPGGGELPSWTKRGFEPWPLFLYADEIEDDWNEEE